ncbi:unnamed protein product [Camellia sinensis]
MHLIFVFGLIVLDFNFWSSLNLKGSCPSSVELQNLKSISIKFVIHCMNCMMIMSLLMLQVILELVILKWGGDLLIVL